MEYKKSRFLYFKHFIGLGWEVGNAAPLGLGWGILHPWVEMGAVAPLGLGWEMGNAAPLGVGWRTLHLLTTLTLTSREKRRSKLGLLESKNVGNHVFFREQPYLKSFKVHASVCLFSFVI